MKVKELIELLQNLDADKEIKFDSEYTTPFVISGIKECREYYIIE